MTIAVRVAEGGSPLFDLEDGVAVDEETRVFAADVTELERFLGAGTLYYERRTQNSGYMKSSISYCIGC